MKLKFLLEFKKNILIFVILVILSITYKKIKYIGNPTTNNSTTLNLKNFVQNNGTKKTIQL